MFYFVSFGFVCVGGVVCLFVYLVFNKIISLSLYMDLAKPHDKLYSFDVQQYAVNKTNYSR